MKVLITGGTGFIGLHTARAFLDAGHEVVATQFRVRRDPAFIAAELGGRLKREVVDITSPFAVNDVMRKHHVDGIVHLAVPAVDASALSPSEDYRTNMQSLINIFDAALTFGVKRVLVASSVAVYESQEHGPYTESMPLPVVSSNSTVAYKKAWEILAYHYADRSKLDVVCARIGYIYGPLYHSMRNVLARMVHAAVHGGEVAGANEAFADDSFDYCYVKDCANALVLLQTASGLRDRIYNVGAGRSTSLAEVLGAARQVASLDVALKPGRRGSKFGVDNYMSLDAIARDTAYAPKFDIRSAVADYTGWLRENEF